MLKNAARDAKIKKEIERLEKEEKVIEKEQKKLEKEEMEILTGMKHIDEEEKWHVDMQFGCKFKLMDDKNILKCTKIDKPCEFVLCPLWKK